MWADFDGKPSLCDRSRLHPSPLPMALIADTRFLGLHEGARMSGRLTIRPMSQQEISQALSENGAGADLSWLQILAALVEQIGDAKVIIENPHLAARLLASQH